MRLECDYHFVRMYMSIYYLFAYRRGAVVFLIVYSLSKLT
jgi:hypothetical protein